MNIMPPKSKETKNSVFRMSCLSDWNYNETNDGKLEQIEAGIKTNILLGEKESVLTFLRIFFQLLFMQLNKGIN